MYCPICDKQLEKYGRRKTDLRGSGWMFCPRHGIFQSKAQEQQQNTNSPKNTKLNRADLENQTTRKMNVMMNKSNLENLIMAAISSIITISIVFMSSYCFQRGSINKSSEIKSFTAAVSLETSDKQILSQSSVLPKEPVPQSETTVAKNMIKEKTLQPPKHSQAIFTVQVGAFTNDSYAEALKDKLDKKGYNAYITIQESNKSRIIYKVLVGRFSSREKAEVLSTKIQKNEGLQTLVLSSRG